MIIVDAHCDTITKIMETGEELFNNNCHIDLERMVKAGKYVQFFAAFIDPSYGQAYAMKRAIQIIDRFYGEIEKNISYVSHCKSHDDIIEALNNNKIAAILSIEGGDALQGDLSALRMFYKLGVRSICLTWNHRNEIADGVLDGASGGGLTPFGKKVIEEMNRLGMIIDLSHISEKGFWDCIELTKKPLIVSHSNAKKLCGHVRNLTDEQLYAVKKNGGVVGINFYSRFLRDDGAASQKDILHHIEYMCSIIGTDHIGFGSDFDGIESMPEDMGGIQDIEKIINDLVKLNYSSDDVEKIAGLNFLRVIKA
ncbi:dipeptidase [Pseudobacteroides cellulosolvens]|uniref:Membrane dipeptidase n=1 Tax=Pseudobacteroides cellulosolvens ATCC 35603 = DSM 2933 TaxID=398512 RepID=A0A0L6JIA9_9FIRM|nr:dipeptidase [Pseudobacteroides cellulosolvens]KNY25433.1 Membrane dipeptidase [Pseudobacteroides cellulosolvens ATCC 35603 = DSM 2933]